MMTSPTNLMDFKSPNKCPAVDIPGTQSPVYNPFKQIDNVSSNIDFNLPCEGKSNTSFKDIDSPFFVPIDLNSSDLMARESLGILPNVDFYRDSLAPGLLNISVKEILDPSSSPRESLGVLNISAMELGRESIGLFNVQNSFLRRKSIEKKHFSFNLDDFSSDNIENGLKMLKNSPLQKDNDPPPEVILSTSTTQDKISSFSLSDLNHAFLLSHSRLPSVVSGGSSFNSFNPGFNSRSLEEPSRISPGLTEKDSEMSHSVLTTTDPFNKAFQVFTNENDKQYLSQILTSSRTKNSFSNEVDAIRSRIQSLPVALEAKNILADLDIDAEAAGSGSFHAKMVCRGIEDERELDDSVFVEARKVASIIADTSFNADEKSFDSKEHNILDATPQPEWPSDMDSSQGNVEENSKCSKCSQKATMMKQVQQMLGMQPVTLEERLKLKSDNNSFENLSILSGISPNNRAENQSSASNNASKISRTSQDGNMVDQSCASSNFSQNLSRISQTSEEMSRLIQNLSDILMENENFSRTQKKQGRHMLESLANILCDSKCQPSPEDSGHSSVAEDQHLEENKVVKIDKDIKSEEISVVKASTTPDMCQALDLSFKGKSCGSEIKKRLSLPNSPALVGSPVSYLPKTPNRVALIDRSNASIASDTSDTNKNGSKANRSNDSNYSNASAKSGNLSTASKLGNISQNKVGFGAGKLKKSKVGVVAAKKGPLRAILPIENMAKGTKRPAKETEGPMTPERMDAGHKFGISSRKTSTPIQEPKLKPMAASTPASRQSKDGKENPASPAPRPKYNNRSFSYQPRASNANESAENVRTKENTLIATKSVISKSRLKIDDTKLARRNSVTEGTLIHQKDGEGPTRIKRSFSTGKEPKILSALNRVRQNILNSPYYNPKKGDGASHSAGLTENANKLGTDLKTCGQELKRLSLMSQPRKLGKENLKP